MSERSLVCRCEDITEADCQDALRDGYTAFEDLKRYLGLATGPCQGKACVAAAIRLIATTRRMDPADVDVMTFRPPVRPIPLGVLAAEDADEEPTHEEGGEE